MTWLDFVFAIIICASMAAGFAKGFIRIGIGFIALCVGIVLASWFYGTAAGWLVPYVTSPGVANFLGFLTVFAIVLTIGALISGILTRVFKLVGLSWLDRLLGGLLGCARGLLASVVLLMIMLAFAPTKTHNAVVDSYLAPYVMDSADLISRITPFELKNGFRKSYEEIKKAWADTMKKKPLKHLPVDKS
jgi:membrane protein required for colicin V production